MYADEVKALVIAALLPTLSENEVVGSEIRFGEGQYRADLVIASPTRLSAFEIKGPKDNLSKLGGQVQGYTDLFLDFSVVTDEVWLRSVRPQIPRSAGLLVLQDSKLQTVRKPRPRARLSPDAALRWLRTSELRHLLRSFNVSSTGHYEALAEAARKHVPISVLVAFALKCIHERIRPRFELFLAELGQTVTLDDILMLTLNDQVIGPHGVIVESGES